MSSSDIQIEVFGKTDVGLIREHNEDNLLIADLGGSFRESELDEPTKLTLSEHGALFLVCDGMGGAAAGEVASQMAVDAVFDVLAASEPQPHEAFARDLRRAVETANDRIFQQSRDNQSERGMGTTCTAAALIDDTLIVAQIGDSRCYVLREGKLGQVTKDQSLAWQLIEAGAMTAEDAKAFEHANIILQALGVQDRVDVVLSQLTLRRGDVMVLCSDGLHGPVTDQEIEEILTTDTDLKKAGEALLQKALERDGPDNITVVLARFDGPGLSLPIPGDTVGFVGYDPGRDPVAETGATPTPEAAGLGSTGRIARPEPRARTATPSPASTGADRSGAADHKRSPGARQKRRDPPKPDDDEGPARRRRLARPPQGKSVMMLFLLALLAAAVGGISVLKCERSQSARGEGAHQTP